MCLLFWSAAVSVWSWWKSSRSFLSPVLWNWPTNRIEQTALERCCSTSLLWGYQSGTNFVLQMSIFSSSPDTSGSNYHIPFQNRRRNHPFSYILHERSASLLCCCTWPLGYQSTAQKVHSQALLKTLVVWGFPGALQNSTCSLDSNTCMWTLHTALLPCSGVSFVTRTSNDLQMAWAAG